MANDSQENDLGALFRVLINLIGKRIYHDMAPPVVAEMWASIHQSVVMSLELAIDARRRGQSEADYFATAMSAAMTGRPDADDQTREFLLRQMDRMSQACWEATESVIPDEGPYWINPDPP